MLIANRSHDDSADATNNYLQKYTIISELILICIFSAIFRAEERPGEGETAKLQLHDGSPGQLHET